MIDTFVLQDLIRKNMREGTISISFNDDKIYVSANHKEKQKDATDRLVESTFVIDRRQPEG